MNILILFVVFVTANAIPTKESRKIGMPFRFKRDLPMMAEQVTITPTNSGEDNDDDSWEDKMRELCEDKQKRSGRVKRDLPMFTTGVNMNEVKDDDDMDDVQDLCQFYDTYNQPQDTLLNGGQPVENEGQQQHQQNGYGEIQQTGGHEQDQTNGNENPDQGNGNDQTGGNDDQEPDDHQVNFDEDPDDFGR